VVTNIMDIRLSILICTIPSRIAPVVQKLAKQAEGKPVEVLYLGDNKMRSVGHKRNDLLRISQGDYVVFVDDDDEVSNGYVDTILKLIETNPDCSCFNIAIRENYGKPKPVHYGVGLIDRDCGTHFERAVNHLMAVRRELAMKVGFKDESFAEDADFAARLRPHLKTSTSTCRTLYWYNYSDSGTETRDV